MLEARWPLALTLLLVPACSDDDTDFPCETDCVAAESDAGVTSLDPSGESSETPDSEGEGSSGSTGEAGTTTSDPGSGPTGGDVDPAAAACAELCVQQTALGCGGPTCEESCLGFYSIPQCPAESVAYIECLTAAQACDLVDTEPMCTAAREALSACAG